MTVGSRRKSSRRVRSKSLIAGLATGLGSIGAFALGITVVMPDIGFGPSDPLPAQHASVDGSAGTSDIGANGEHAGGADPLDEKANGDASSLPSSRSGEFIPGDRAGSDWADNPPDNPPDNGALYQAENSSNSNSFTQPYQDEAAAGRGQRGNTNRGRFSRFNAPGSGGFSGNDNPGSGGGTFSGGAPFTADLDPDGLPDGLEGNTPSVLAGLEPNDPNFSDTNFNDTNFNSPRDRGFVDVVPPGTGFPGRSAEFAPPSLDDPQTQEIAPDPENGQDTVQDDGEFPTSGGGDGPFLEQEQEQENDGPGSNTPPSQSLQIDPDQSVMAVPEPGALGMMAFGLFAMWNIRPLRRRQ
jgi:hypothetical protein